MRIPSYHNDEGLGDNRSMTSMIDVVFLLLIFFVCASVGTLVESGMATPLSEGTTGIAEFVEQDQAIERLWVYLKLDAEGALILEVNGLQFGDFTSFGETLTQLAEIDREMPVILDIAEDITVQDFVRLYDLCRDIGFTSVNFAADPPETSP